MKVRVTAGELGVKHFEVTKTAEGHENVYVWIEHFAVGEVCELDDKEADRLIKNGAVEAVDSEPSSPVSEEDGVDDERARLEALSIGELRRMAKERGAASARWGKELCVDWLLTQNVDLPGTSGFDAGELVV